jgi:hypothetical protein
VKAALEKSVAHCEVKMLDTHTPQLGAFEITHNNKVRAIFLY